MKSYNWVLYLQFIVCLKQTGTVHNRNLVEVKSLESSKDTPDEVKQISEETFEHQIFHKSKFLVFCGNMNILNL